MPFLYIIARSGFLLYAPFTALYWWADQSGNERGYFAYRNQDDCFDHAEARLAGQGAQVACGCHGTRVPYQRLWGHPTSVNTPLDYLLYIGIATPSHIISPCRELLLCFLLSPLFLRWNRCSVIHLRSYRPRK